jgi:hypothetical protein
MAAIIPPPIIPPSIIVPTSLVIVSVPSNPSDNTDPTPPGLG